VSGSYLLSTTRSWRRYELPYERVGSTAQPGGVAGSALTDCAGSRFRPLAVGYVRLWPSDPPGHADALAAQLRAFAHRCGLALTDTYTEHTDVPASREGAAFRALVEALRRPHIRAVVIPSPEHFSRFGDMYRAMRTVINVETGADMLIMSNKGGGAS
jgi:nucleotide-binding universal stress UspA family protein